MAKMTLKALRSLREEQKNAGAKSIQIIVGMGTCGIAAGAQDAFDLFQSKAENHKAENIIVKKTGCMGLCHAEPTVEIKKNGMPDTLYGNVDTELAEKIVQSHVLSDTLLKEHVYQYPAQDIHKE